MGCALYSPYVLLALDMNHNALHCTAAEFVGEERRGGEMSGGRGGGGGFKKKRGLPYERGLGRRKDLQDRD